MVAYYSLIQLNRSAKEEIYNLGILIKTKDGDYQYKLSDIMKNYCLDFSENEKNDLSLHIEILKSYLKDKDIDDFQSDLIKITKPNILYIHDNQNINDKLDKLYDRYVTFDEVFINSEQAKLIYGLFELTLKNYTTINKSY